MKRLYKTLEQFFLYRFVLANNAALQNLHFFYAAVFADAHVRRKRKFIAPTFSDFSFHDGHTRAVAIASPVIHEAIPFGFLRGREVFYRDGLLRVAR